MTSESLITTLERSALSKQMPDGSITATLSVDQIEQLAIRHDTDGKSIEIAALEIGILPERYSRNFGTFTAKDQIKLLKSQVAVVGLGGLGGIVTEYLARAGVGQLNLIDGDRFEDHNLNRQILCTHERLGSSKAQSAAERVCNTNTSLTVLAFSDFINTDNAYRFLDGCDAVVDCLDSIDTRLMLQVVAQDASIPLISAAVAGLCGHITTIFPNDRGLELIYGPSEQNQPQKGAETTLGCLPQAVGLIAAGQSAEIIKVLLGQKVLRNKILMMDVASHSYEVLALM